MCSKDKVWPPTLISATSVEDRRSEVTEVRTEDEVLRIEGGY